MTGPDRNLPRDLATSAPAPSAPDPFETAELEHDRRDRAESFEGLDAWPDAVLNGRPDMIVRVPYRLVLEAVLLTRKHDHQGLGDELLACANQAFRDEQRIHGNDRPQTRNVRVLETGTIVPLRGDTA